MTNFHELPYCVSEALIESFDVDTAMKIMTSCQDDISNVVYDQLSARLQQSGFKFTTNGVSIVDTVARPLNYSTIPRVLQTFSQSKSPIKLEKISLNLDLKLKNDFEILNCLANYIEQTGNSPQIQSSIFCRMSFKISYHKLEKQFKIISLKLLRLNTAFVVIDLKNETCQFIITDIKLALMQQQQTNLIFQLLDIKNPTESLSISNVRLRLKFLPVGLKHLTLINCQIHDSGVFPQLQSLSLKRTTDCKLLINKYGPKLISLELENLESGPIQIKFDSFTNLQRLTIKEIESPSKLIYPPSLTKLIIDTSKIGAWVLDQHFPQTLNHLEFNSCDEFDYTRLRLSNMKNLKFLKLLNRSTLNYDQFDCPSLVIFLQVSGINKSLQHFKFPSNLQQFVYLSSTQKSIVIPSSPTERKKVIGVLKRDALYGH